jgi:hypothetical protein
MHLVSNLEKILEFLAVASFKSDPKVLKIQEQPNVHEH